MPRLHPALGAPAFELDLLGLQMLRGNDGGGAVVLLHAIDLDEVASAESPWSWACPDTAWDAECKASRHTGARTPDWRWIDSRVSSGLPTISPPTTYILFLCRCSMARSVALPVLRPASRNSFLAAAFKNCKIILENVLDAKEHVAKTGLPHQRRQGFAVHRDGRCHRLHGVRQCRSSRRR